MEWEWEGKTKARAKGYVPPPLSPAPPPLSLPHPTTLCRAGYKNAIFFTFYPFPPCPRKLSFAFSMKDYAWINCMHWVRSLLSRRGMLLGYSLEPRPNSRALASVGLFMAIVLSINRCLTGINQFDHRKQDWLVQRRLCSKGAPHPPWHRWLSTFWGRRSMVR